jgi:hypothetical protein
MFRAASWTRVFISRLIFFCCSILRTDSYEKLAIPLKGAMKLTLLY